MRNDSGYLGGSGYSVAAPTREDRTGSNYFFQSLSILTCLKSRVLVNHYLLNSNRTLRLRMRRKLLGPSAKTEVLEIGG